MKASEAAYFVSRCDVSGWLGYYARLLIGNMYDDRNIFYLRSNPDFLVYPHAIGLAALHQYPAG